MGNLTVAFKIKMCISTIQQFLKKSWVAQPLSLEGWGGGRMTLTKALIYAICLQGK